MSHAWRLCVWLGISSDYMLSVCMAWSVFCVRCMSTFHLCSSMLAKHCVLLSTHADRQGVDLLFTVCVFVCLFVRLRISPPRINLAASNFAGGLSASKAKNLIFVNVAPPETQNRTNRPARPCCHVMLLGSCDSHVYQVHAACGRRIVMCGCTSVLDV